MEGKDIFKQPTDGLLLGAKETEWSINQIGFIFS